MAEGTLHEPAPYVDLMRRVDRDPHTVIAERNYYCKRCGIRFDRGQKRLAKQITVVKCDENRKCGRRALKTEVFLNTSANWAKLVKSKVLKYKRVSEEYTTVDELMANLQWTFGTVGDTAGRQK